MTALKEMLNQVFRARASTFKTRSPDRDRQTDAANVALVLKAINAALVASESERAGLARRVADVLSRAAVTVGNDVDEYIDRDDRDTGHLNRMDAEIQSGQSRLKQLDHNIAQFEALKLELALKFPDVLIEAA
ncbi:MAG: hypothetical protein ACTHNN_04400 [Xanthobacteraceae bacterium]